MRDVRVVTSNKGKAIPEHDDHSPRKELDDGSSIPVFSIRLNEKLDINNLFNAFIDELGTRVAFDSVEYNNELRKIFLRKGISGKHRSVYTITYGKQQLGRLRLTRDKKFTNSEMHMFETMIAGLVVPLHNVMQYQDAIP